MDSQKEKLDVDTEVDKSVSALEHNIKTKKDNSYYYAHAYKFDNRASELEAKTISGPGIITGGDPVLLGKTIKNVEIIKENKKFTKYIFYDDEEFAVVKIDLPEECKDFTITDDCLEMKLQERSLDLKVNIKNSDPYFFSVKKLSGKIIPEESTIKIVKGKIIINIKKKDEDEEWSKLSA